jgi:hypothetical protein
MTVSAISMNTKTTPAAAAIFFSNLHRANSWREEIPAIAGIMGKYSVGEPHGTQLDMARHAARVILDPSIKDVEIRIGSAIAELSPAERELLRRWRNYERRVLIARNALRDLDAEILETTESGDIPDSEMIANRTSLVEEVEFWQRKADNPVENPLEVDSYQEEKAETESLESLISSQKQDIREWRRMSR